MSDLTVQLIFGAALIFIGAVSLFVTTERIWDWWWSETLKATPIRRFRFRHLPDHEARAKAGGRLPLRIIGGLFLLAGCWTLGQTLWAWIVAV